MINPILPNTVSEGYRLSQSGMHQGLVVALQSEIDGLRIKSPGVIVEISQAALKAAEKDKNNRKQKTVKAISPISGSDVYYPFHKP